MESKFKVLGHGAHPILIVFPLGLLSTAVIFDIVYLATSNTQFSVVSYWMISAGIIGGVVAAVPGFVDWLSIPKDTRAKKVGLFHAILNDIVLVLFAVSWWFRHGAPRDYQPDNLALACSFVAVVFALVAGWLGGELVERHAMAVHDGANLNAPSSLSGRPAGDRDSK
jgi:uncharacterized membrane protein